MKRAFLLLGVLAAVAFLAGAPSVSPRHAGLLAQTPPPGETDEATYGKEITPEIRRAIDRGLEYMVSQQNPDTGAFDAPDNTRLATTAVCGLALLAGGNTPGRGRYGEQVTKTIEFILRCQSIRGYLTFGSSNMYSHGFATMFLAEVYGMLPPRTELGPRVRKVLVEAIRLIEEVQDGEGGWWYEPVKANGSGADISVTVCETMALRAAKDAGIEVDKRVVNRAIKCVTNAANKSDGGFAYRVQGGRATTESAFERTAAGVCILQGLGVYNEEVTQRGLNYLMERLPSEATVSARNRFYYYGCYYSTQAMFTAGGDRWKKWYRGISMELLGKQSTKGSWPSGEGGDAYAAGMSLIVLQIPYRYLPILEGTE